MRSAGAVPMMSGPFSRTQGVITHWNGQRWSVPPSGTTSSLYGVWGSAANDVWVVGAAGTILHFNGATFTPVASGVSATLFGVWGASASEVWAVGSNGMIDVNYFCLVATTTLAARH